jgi:hypothetical protein
VVPFGIARAGDPLPSLSLPPYLIVIGVAAVLTVTTAMGAARRAISGRAVDAIV